jgi:hypothetical protein
VLKRPEELFLEGLQGEKVAAPVAAPAEEPKASVIVAPKGVTQKNLFAHPDTHPVVLDLALLKFFHTDWLGWLPETLFGEIEQVFKTSIAEVNRLKIMGSRLLHVSDSFWDSWEIFEKVIQALNGQSIRLDVMQPPDLPSLFSGVEVANSIRQEKFSPEVSRYVAACMLYEDVHYAPPPVDFCQPFLAQPLYHCNDCGKEGSALPPFDGHCTSCAMTYDHEKPFSFKPDEEALARGAGKNISLLLKYDPEPTKSRYEELEKLPAGSLPSAIREVFEDIQSAKLIVATDFKNYRIQQLKDQLSDLRGWLEVA